MVNIIETTALSFGYGRHKKVLDNVSLHIPEGAIYGFLGPNGAGKSTTMRLLTGIIPEQGNAIRLFGEPLRQQMPGVFSKIGSLVEQPALYLHLSGIDNLRYIARLRGVSPKRIPAMLELVGLANDGKRKVKQYSLGMKQRLAIAMALLDEPALLLLDEPVNGLDPNGIQEIRQLLMRLNRENGVTIFVSSHLLPEIEKMCTHVGIIHNGQLKFEGRMDELSARFATANIVVTLGDAVRWAERLEPLYPGLMVLHARQIRFMLPTKEAVPGMVRSLVDAGADIYELRMEGGLEDWFMSLIDTNK
ncbi:ABC-2 type transport system ATP-binding protein [Parapedobacter composti]|uniref:ABC-2 type transport system ATP-binding protein n=1 Tax=Parapedobacter composti TaxID=623281 RepID=A0A1I1J6Y3_9SPHI|nr:ABC transporter ATP-binding protein [Parapedobacter composti]SFC44369.1 ABC-2 type transport system ATP-binding protein [Parapedobacter composti]